jgi:pre-mRNA-splicing factor CDC5/CEF1
MLPKPKNEFEIVLPEADEIEPEKVIEEDQEQVQKRLELARIAEEERKAKLRSKAIQLDLPRPVVSFDLLKSMYQEDDDTVDGMIQKEKALLLYRDATDYPVAGQKPFDFYSVEELDDYLEEAGLLIENELEGYDLEPIEFPKLFVDYDIDFVNNRFVDSLTEEQHESNHGYLREKMKQEAMKSQKLEKKLSITLGGYKMREKHLKKQFEDTFEELQEKKRDLELFLKIKEMEVEFAQVRVSNERKKLETLAMKEQDLQDRYRELRYQRDELVR